MINGPLVTAVIAVVAIGAVIGAFMTNSSPYVTIAEARRSTDDRLHLAGDIVKDSIKTDFATRRVSFQVKDSTGTVILVEHRGEPVAGLTEATKVVAVGGMKGDHFVSEKLLLKCPSKYESPANRPAPARS